MLKMVMVGQWWHACLQMTLCCLQRLVDESYGVYTRRQLKVNARKSKVMVFERREVEMVYFNTPNRVSVPATGRCEMVVGGEKMEEIKEFKYLGAVLCKHG